MILAFVHTATSIATVDLPASVGVRAEVTANNMHKYQSVRGVLTLKLELPTAI